MGERLRHDLMLVIVLVVVLALVFFLNSVRIGLKKGIEIAGSRSIDGESGGSGGSGGPRGPIAGDVILIGGPEEKKGTEQGQGADGATSRGDQSQRASENLRCWRDAGLSEDDIKVVGSIASMKKCEDDGEDSVSGKAEDGCIVLSVGEVDTKICDLDKDEKGPFFDIDFGGVLDRAKERVMAGPLVEFQKETDYYPGIFLIVMMLVGVLIWKEFELMERKRDSSHWRGHGHEHGEFKPELFEEEKKVEVKYIKAAPIFGEFGKEAREEKRKVFEEVEREKEELVARLHLEKVRRSQVKELIGRFNEASKIASGYLRQDNLDALKKAYLQMFPIYSRLIDVVNDDNKKGLQEVIAYFHREIRLREESLRISRLIERAYKGVKVKPRKAEDTGIGIGVSAEVGRVTHDDLEKLRKLLEKKKYAEAKKFYDSLKRK